MTMVLEFFSSLMNHFVTTRQVYNRPRDNKFWTKPVKVTVILKLALDQLRNKTPHNALSYITRIY